MSRRRRRAASPAVTTEERLTAATATCPVCLSILIRPVTMPCRHTLCTPCFDSNVDQSSLSCPLCRTRISVWLRKARRAGSLVDERLWSRLQREFPTKVQARLEGREADFSEEDLEPVAPLLSAPGEIRREFEQQLSAVRDEDEELRSRSERASKELIDRLQQETAEETSRRQEQERRDAELARGVMQEEMFISPGRPALSAGAGGGGPRPSGSSTPLRGPMDVYLGQMTPRVGGKRPVSPIRPRAAAAPAAEVPPPSFDTTPSPTGSGKENSDPAAAAGGRGGSVHSSDSADSIRAELRHFKPIRSAPRTPPKRRPDGVLGAPPVVQSVARFLGRGEVKKGSEASRDRPRPAQAAGAGGGRAGTGVVDAGGGGDSGEDRGRVAAGKRPAEEQPTDSRPSKRRAPTATATSGAGSDERDAPVLEPPSTSPPVLEHPLSPPVLEPPSSPPPPPTRHRKPSQQDSDSDFEFDLNSAELLEQQREAERLLEVELADRRLAEQLQRELNAVPPVDRTKGSEGAYSLRGADEGQSSGVTSRSGQRRPQAAGRSSGQRRPQAATAGGRRQANSRPAGRRDRAQLSIQESLNRSARAASPEW